MPLLILVFLGPLLASSELELFPESRDDQRPKAQKPSDLIDREFAVFLGGDTTRGGPGRVLQLGGKGNVLGAVELPRAPYDVKSRPEGLVMVLPAGNVTRDPTGKTTSVGATGTSNVVGLGADAKPKPIIVGKRVAHPIAVAIAPKSGALLVADNRDDLLVRHEAVEDDFEKLLAFPHNDHFQNISIACNKDDSIVYGGALPLGVYRIKRGRTKFGKPLWNEDAAVAADPNSAVWVAASHNELRVYRRNKLLGSLSYPEHRFSQYGAMAFSPKKKLYMVLHDRTKATPGKRQTLPAEVYEVDLEKQRFKLLFVEDTMRVVTLAVAPYLDWKSAQSAGEGQ